ncbi:MAG: nitroreductase family protein [Tuberibacillus sp.]
MTTTSAKLDINQYRKPTYDIESIFIKRWSGRSFLEKNVPDGVLYSLLEAARWAPSAANWQPWRFIIARTREDREVFHSFINEKNRKWCEKAPILMLVLSKKTNADGKTNAFHAFDAGAAWAHFALQAAAKGLMTHPMGGYDKNKARDVLNIPEDYELQAVVAIGYQGDPEALPDDFKDREKPSDRKPLSAMVFEGQFNKNIKDI